MDNQSTTHSSPPDPEYIASCSLAGEFVDHLLTREDASDPTETSAQALRRATAGSSSLEQAVGRWVVVADLMSRGVVPRSALVEEPFDAKGPGSFIARLSSTRRSTSAVLLGATVLLVSLIVAVTTTFGGSPPVGPKAVQHGGTVGNAQLVGNEAPEALTADRATTTTVNLPSATVPPAPAPPSLAAAPPLRPHEVFGFAPYWTLSQSSGFDLSQISTIDYFSVGVNANGTLDESGPGWNGYLSQDFASLITRAHAAGDRVVLTVNDFDQSSLDQLTSSATAPTTLATALLGAMQAKNLDGANFDFEGSGSADQTGLTNLVTQVSDVLHHANPNYQVTMDTYASSAGDPKGFYNIPALAPAVDGIFVMAYQLNLQSPGSPDSPLTSSMFSEKTAIAQYAAAMPPAKVILGMPYFGIDWPTSDGTLSATATGPATNVTYGQVKASGHPIYWDATTQTGWTSYLVGTQWHESFFEVPTSLYDAAQLAASYNVGGMGIWALGMDGNDSTLLSALRGFSPAVKSLPAGPTTTSTSTSSTSTSSTTTPSTPTPSTSTPSPSTSSTSTSSTSTSSTSPGSTSTSPASTTSTSVSSSSTTSTTSPQTRRPTGTTSTTDHPSSLSTTTTRPSSPLTRI